MAWQDDGRYTDWMPGMGGSSNVFQLVDGAGCSCAVEGCWSPHYHKLLVCLSLTTNNSHSVQGFGRVSYRFPTSGSWLQPVALRCKIVGHISSTLLVRFSNFHECQSSTTTDLTDLTCLSDVIFTRPQSVCETQSSWGVDWILGKICCKLQLQDWWGPLLNLWGGWRRIGLISQFLTI